MDAVSRNCTRGFSLLEVLVATSLVVIGVATLAQLFGAAIAANARGRATTVSVLLAQQKMEEVVAAFAEHDAQGGLISASPEGALDRNTPGFCDFIDRHGQSLGGGTSPPPGAVQLRRWSIVPLPMYADVARLLQVLSTPVRGASDAVSDVTRRPETARLITIRTRRSL